MLSLKNGVASVFFTKVIVALVGLLTVIITSKVLGAQGRGAVSLFTASVALVQMFCDFGSSSALINLSYRINQWKLWLSAVWWILGICAFATVFSFYLETSFIQWVPLSALLFSLLNLNNLLLMGNRMVNQRNILLVVQPILLLIFFLGFIQFNLFPTASYPMAFTVALFVTLLISFIWIASPLKLAQKQLPKFQFETQILSQGLWVQGGQAIQFLNYRINFFILVFFMGNTSLGIYNNAIVIGESLWILGHSLGQMLHMKILNSDNPIEHRNLTMRMLLLSFAGTSLMLIILLFIPATFWEWLFSKEFVEVKMLFYWLAPGILVFSISNILNHFFHAKNQFKFILLVNLIGLVIGVVVSLICIPLYGLQGACIAWSAALLMSMLMYVSRFFSAHNLQDA
jgi:O-antigen/teichoic acid export membrane protein